jgi:hypothetical protein
MDKGRNQRMHAEDRHLREPHQPLKGKEPALRRGPGDDELGVIE